MRGGLARYSCLASNSTLAEGSKTQLRADLYRKHQVLKRIALHRRVDREVRVWDQESGRK